MQMDMQPMLKDNIQERMELLHMQKENTQMLQLRILMPKDI